MNRRTRIKVCGLTRQQDVAAAVAAGADALGLVFYAASPRHVSSATASELIATIPPFISTVGLFVNANQDEVAAVIAQAPLSLLQFHGDESASECAAIAAAVNRPFIRALRVKPDMVAADLVEYELEYRAASTLCAGLLLDTFVDSYGGSGKVFDWSLIPESIASRVVLSGGLNAQNVTDAIQQIRPHAVDVSSGVEIDKGIKDLHKIRAFINAVRVADSNR
tara:strand:+ start:126 stop:791 length:666 start_codon:yes stop_codon:yes gene_type:complete